MLSFLYVYSDHSILECYNLFSGVELSMRSFFVIIIAGGCIGVLLVNWMACDYMYISRVMYLLIYKLLQSQ